MGVGMSVPERIYGKESPVSATITSDSLGQLLASSKLHGADAAEAAARGLGDAELPVSRRRARRSAETLAKKYSLALARGHTVRGLSHFVTGLLREQGGDTAEVKIHAAGEYFLVNLDHDLRRVIGVVHVVPRTRDVS